MAALTLSDLPSEVQLTAAARVQQLLDIASGPALAVVAAVLDGIAAATPPPAAGLDVDDARELWALVDDLKAEIIAAERCDMPEWAEQLRRRRHALVLALDHAHQGVLA